MKKSTFLATLVTLFVISVATSNYASEGFREKFKLENEHLLISVGENNLFTITDKKTGVVWHPDPWAGTTGEIRVTYPANLFDKQVVEKKTRMAIVDINKAREVVCRRKGAWGVQWISSGFTMEGRPLKGRVAFEIKLARDKPIIEIELTELKIEQKNITLKNLHFLPRWFSLKLGVDTGYLVVPLSQGYIFPVGDVGLDRIDWLSGNWGIGQRAFSRADHPYVSFFGMVNGDSSLTMRLEDVYDTDVQVHGNQVGGWRKPRISTVYPIVLPIMGELGHSRKFVVEVIPHGSYVNMAKRHRSWLKSIGMYKTLKEKIRELPSVEKLLGTPIVYINPGFLKTIKAPGIDPRLTGSGKLTGKFDGIPNMMRALKTEGVNKAFVMIWCWERAGGGFEEPDHWPPNEELGGLKEFKKLFSRQLRKEFPEYIMGFYNIYNDMYDDAPSFDRGKITINKDGSLNRSGLWHGGVARVICPTQYRGLAEKDFAAYLRELEQLDCMLYDNFAIPRECYSPIHPVTRAESAKLKKDFIDWTVSKGLITGIEFTRDWIAPNIHYCDGAVGAYGRNMRNVMHENIVPVPLWDLVCHESTVNYWWHWNNYVFSPTYVMNRQYTWMDMVLQDILCANPGTWSIHPEVVDYWSKIMGQVAPLQSKISKSLAHVEMVGHEFLERSCMVQKSIWADGTEIYVNFRDKKFKKGNIELSPKSFHLVGSPELPELKGAMVEGFRLD